jgi:hypothetical protein
MFAEDRIRQFNDTPTMKKAAVDPRDFMGTTVYDKEAKQEKPANLQDAGFCRAARFRSRRKPRTHSGMSLSCAYTPLIPSLHKPATAMDVAWPTSCGPYLPS